MRLAPRFSRVNNKKHKRPIILSLLLAGFYIVKKSLQETVIGTKSITIISYYILLENYPDNFIYAILDKLLIRFQNIKRYIKV